MRYQFSVMQAVRAVRAAPNVKTVTYVTRVTVLPVLSSILLLSLAACGGNQSAPQASAEQSGSNLSLAFDSLRAAPAAPSSWSAPIPLSLVPAAASNLPDGHVLFWSANDRFSFGAGGQTYFSNFDPLTNKATETLISATGHDMFCPGTALLSDGRLLVNGGIDSGKTSIYNPANASWSSAANMNITRGYNASTTLADGSVFTLGGSWSGGAGNKHGEIWDNANGWRRLSGVSVANMLTNDAGGVYRGDNHMWLIPTGNGKVLHAGPSRNMNWINTRGNGSVSPAGQRADDADSMNGNTVMYDAGKILKVGGAKDYQDADASNSAYLINTNGSLSVRKLASMSYARAYSNLVVLPDGKVMVIGGQTRPVPFSDNTAVLAPELWDPVTETFTTLPAMSVPRVYHSVALLMHDGRVLSAGGGLCGNGCAANHQDIQIYTPSYLLNADGTAANRPVLTAVPATAGYGSNINISATDGIAAFALIRLSATTHTVNNDQRRIALSFTRSAAGQYTLNIPGNPGILLPGNYMLFGLDAKGVPSIAKTINIHGNNAPKLQAPDDQFFNTGSNVSLNVTATVAAPGAVSFRASGLPPGLSINAQSGVISGVVTQAGSYSVTVFAQSSGAYVSSDFVWNVAAAGSTRFVKLVQMSEVGGNPWASMAEFNLLDQDGNLLPRAGWKVSADSAEAQAGNHGPANAIDGDPNTIWHTAWTANATAAPHSFVVDLGKATQLSAFRYLPRPGGGNGTIARFYFYTSADGVNWGNPVAEGNLADFQNNAAEKTIYLNNLARGKATSQSSMYQNFDSARAVDGISDGNLANGSVTHTAGTAANDWWQVDLGSVQDLSRVRIWNRSDCCAERLGNFYVLASAQDMSGRSLNSLLADTAVTKSYYAGVAPSNLLLDLKASGRYVKVQLAGTNFLQLAEVQVYGRPANRAPTLNMPTFTGVQLGQTVNLNLQANDPDGDTLSFTASGLPPGLTLNAATGLISGTTTRDGSFMVSASVSDGRGGVASQNFVMNVTLPAAVISPITVQPQTSGSTVSYQVSATGSGLTYAWDFGDGSANSNTFSASATTTHQYTQPGLYRVTATVKNLSGIISTYSFYQAVTTPAIAGQARASSALLTEKRAGGDRIWVVNPDNDSVAVMDAQNLQKLAEIAVGKGPRQLALTTDGKVWVSNRDAASLSVIDSTTLKVSNTVALPVGSQPFGIVAAANEARLYVALEALGQVWQIDSATGKQMASLSVGATPRYLSLHQDSDRLLVSRFITPALPGEGTAKVQTTVNGVNYGGIVVVANTHPLRLQTSVILQHSDKQDAQTQGRGIPNYLAAAAIAPDGVSAWIPSKQDNILRGSLRDGKNLDFQNTVRAISARINLNSMKEDYAARVDINSTGLVSAAAFHPGGAYLFLALENTRQIAVLDPVGAREMFRFDAGRAPQGLSFSSDGNVLFVNNFMDRTVSRFDLTPMLQRGQMQVGAVQVASTIAAEKLSAQVLIGKQHFYDARDPRLARGGWLSCTACHSEAGADGRTWDFTGLGEGLRNTISLRGRAGGQMNLHWSGNFDELQDFESQIRSFAQGTGLMKDADYNAGTRNQPLGDKKAGLSADLDALAAYMASLRQVDASPYRNADNSLTVDGKAGRGLFNTYCASCHTGVNFTVSGTALGKLYNIGTLKASSGQRQGTPLTGLDVPTLRDVWDTAPYLHDGSAATVQQAIAAHNPATINAANPPLLGAGAQKMRSFTDAELNQLAAFVKQIGNAELVGGAVRYVKLEQLGEVNNNAWGSMAEFNLVNEQGALLARSNWKASADSVELQGENGAAANAIDGNKDSIWHTQWQTANPRPPHWFRVDLGGAQELAGFRYLPRVGGGNGTMSLVNFYVSSDGVNWGDPVWQGDFRQINADNAAEKSVLFANIGNPAAGLQAKAAMAADTPVAQLQQFASQAWSNVQQQWGRLLDWISAR